MADFNSKISTIRGDLDALLGTIRSVETELHDASTSFAELAANAKDISTLTSAIQKLDKFLNGKKSPFLDEIKDRVSTINTELGKLNVRQLETATSALEANAKAMAAISRAQANTNRNLEAAKGAIDGVRNELTRLEEQGGKVGTGLEASLGKITASVEKLSRITGVDNVISSLNALDATKYNQAADALDRIAATLRVLKQANVSIDVSAASEGQKLSKKPIQPVVKDTVVEVPVAPSAPRAAPQARPRTVAFAQERGVNLADVEGTGARGLVTKEDVLRHVQSRAPIVDAAAAAAKSAELRNALEKRVSALNKLDEAIATIETAQDKAFQAAVREHGGAKTSSQRAIARNYLLHGNDPNISPEEKRNRKLDFEQIRKNKTFDDLEVEFNRQLRDIDVKTNLPDGLDQFKAGNTEIVNKIKKLRENVNTEAERLSKEISEGPSFALSHVINTARRKVDRTNPDDVQVTPEARAKVELDTRTGARYTKGNGRLGATGLEAGANLAALEQAVDASPHKIAVVTTTGTNAGAASAIPGAGAADHVLLVFKNLEGKLEALEHLGDATNLAPGNKTGNVAFGAYAPERRSVEEIAAAADSVRALPLTKGTPEQAQTLLEQQRNLTKPGEAVYSFANELTNSQLVAIGDTCATATAEAFKRSGILDTIEQTAKFANVPGTKGTNLLTPEEVLTKVSESQGTYGPKDKLNTLVDETILKIPGNGISAQYRVNADRGYAEGRYTGEVNAEDAGGRVGYDPHTGTYSSKGDKISGATKEDAAATRLAILKAIADSEHGIALVGVSGRSAGGKSASNYGALDATSASDHALVAYLENGIVKIAELLADSSKAVKAKNVKGEEVNRLFHPGADDFQDVYRTWDQAHAVPLNGITDEQADQFKTNLKDSTQPGAAYGLEKSFDDAGRLIGETCVTVIAQAGAKAGIFPKGYGDANADGKNLLHPSALLKFAEAKNEEFRRRSTDTEPISLDEANAFVKDAEASVEAVKNEVQRYIAKRKELVYELLAGDKELSEDIDYAVQSGTLQSKDHFVTNVATDFKAQETSGESGSTISRLFTQHGVENSVGPKLLDKVQEARDIADIGKGAQETALRRAQDDALLKSTLPKTSVRVEALSATALNTSVHAADAIKENLTPLSAAVKAFIAKVGATLKDVFARIGSTFDDLLGSVGHISFGDIGTLVKNFFKAPQASSAPQQQAAPAFALTDVGDAANKFSKNVYRPFSFGVSQFGAGLNSVREIANGAKEGGPGGALDIIGGIIKFLHTIANSNAFFGLKLLPKGVGEIFNQRRSETLLDIAETGVGAATGYRRSPVDKTLRRLRAEEEPLANKVVDLKERVDNASASGLSESDILALRQELAKNVEELRQLRSQINAYRVVVSREAEEESKRTGGRSTGAALDPDEPTPTFARSFQDSTNETFSKIKQFVGEKESLLSSQASESLQRFSAGTGLQAGVGGGIAVVPQQNALEATKQFFTQAQIGNVQNHQIQGLSVPVLDEVGKRISSVILTTTSQSERRAGVIVHEATHELVEQKGREGNALYTGTTPANLAFADTALEKKRSDRYTNVNAAGNGGANADYLFDPREMFAHIGEALISGNDKLENELRKLYGDDLYNDVVKTLESTLPDTFAPQYLAGLQAKFAAFNLEINQLFSQANGPTVDIGKVFGDLFSAFNLPPGAVKTLTDKFQNLIPAISDTLQSPESRSRLLNAATPLLYNEDSFKGRAISSLNRAGGNELLGSAFKTFQDPTQDNINELLKGVKKSPELIKKALTTYISEALNIDEGILKRLPGKDLSLGKIAAHVVNQFTPDEVNFRDQANEKIQKITGRNLREGTFQQSSSIDTSTGIERFSLSAQTATGAMIQLNGHVDEFGRKKLDEPEKAVNRFSAALKEVTIGGLRQIGDNFTYGIVNSFQEMFHQLVGIQDELGEVANLLGVVGDKATRAKSQFLFQSVNTAVKTGQGFDEAIQTNLKNFKILGSVKDPTKRADLANQVSEVQLGAQTAFGISLEQSLESIPAILATIKDGMEGIDDPAQKVTASIGELRDVMDQVVVAQRTTGAQGDELLTVYSRLSASAKDYGLNSKQLLAITATSSTAIGKGSDETSNILRSFIEGTYSSANQGGFAKNGIATQNFNASTNQLENRSFEDVLKDLYKLSQDSSKTIDYKQLLQSIGGPKLAPDISKVIQGFGNNYGDTVAALDNTPKGAAQTLVGQKSQNFAGSLNKLQATGTQFLGSLLVGTGGFDKAAKLFDTLSDSAVKLTGFLNDNEGSIKKVVEALAPFVKFFTVGLASKDLNLFSPLAKGLLGVETKFSSTISKLTDFGKVGESSSSRVQRTINLIGVALKELDEGFIRTGASGQAAFAKIAETGAVAAKAVNPTTTPSFALATAPLNPYETARLNPYETSKLALEDLKTVPSKTPLNDRLGNKALNTSGITDTDLAQLRGQEIAQSSSFSLRAEADDFIATAGKPSRLSQIRKGLEKPGAAAGALAAPVAFDLISGGLGKDNLVNVGVGIAGGIAGAFVGGPLGATVGYSIAKAISENIDLPGSFGTSEKEASTFAEKLAQVVFNKKPAEGTPEDQQKNRELSASQLAGIQEKLGTNTLRTAAQGFEDTTRTNVATYAISADTVKSYLDFQKQNGRGPGFLDNYSLQNPDTESTIGLFGGNTQLLDLFAGSGLSSVREFLEQLDQASQGIGPLADEFGKLSVQTQQQASASAEVADADIKRAQLQSAQDLIQAGQQQQTDLESKLQNDYQTPYGLDKYNAFSPLSQSLNSSFGPQIDKINKGDYSGPQGGQRSQEAQAVLDRLARSQESLAALPQTLQQLVPLAQSLGLNSKGLEQRLYNVGAEGQGQIAQRFAPAIEADRSVQTYELQRSRLQSLQRTDQFKAKDPAILAEVAALQKALATDKARYDINKAFLELLKSQSGALLDQTAQVEAQQKTRQLISPGTAGTPAQFTAASIFDTKGTTATEINNAIDFALRKQSKLEALNPEYKKEFAKDQFLLQSGGNFKGVTGVNQGFVQEYLQQQQQQKEAPLQDLSQYSNEQIDKILEKAKSLQGQAEKLDPAREGKYDNDRILILRKNNDLLSKTGIGQEFLKAAIDANTKSNDTLRGHYNLPSNYKAPTIFDYYDNGGKEKGDQNFPGAGGQGLVPLSFAQELAKQLVSGDNGQKGADLAGITDTNQAGARPLFYPTPGTPGTAAIYSEVEPQIIPDTIKSDQKISDAVQRFFDFKQRQIDDFDSASTGTGQTVTDIEDIRATRAVKPNTNAATYEPSGSTPPPQGYGNGGGGGGNWDTGYGTGGGGGGEWGSDSPASMYATPDVKSSSEKTKTTLQQLGASSDKTKDNLNALSGGAAKAGTAISAVATALPSAGLGAAALVTGATAFNGAVTALVAKVASFDLAQALRSANVIITVNGQSLPTSAVSITSSTATGTSTLAAGPTTGSKQGNKF